MAAQTKLALASDDKCLAFMGAEAVLSGDGSVGGEIFSVVIGDQLVLWEVKLVLRRSKRQFCPRIVPIRWSWWFILIASLEDLLKPSTVVYLRRKMSFRS